MKSSPPNSPLTLEMFGVNSSGGAHEGVRVHRHQSGRLYRPAEWRARLVAGRWRTVGWGRPRLLGIHGDRGHARHRAAYIREGSDLRAVAVRREAGCRADQQVERPALRYPLPAWSTSALRLTRSSRG